MPTLFSRTHQICKTLRIATASMCLWIASSPASQAQSLDIRVNSEYAEKLLDVVCSGNEVDEAFWRGYEPLLGQIKHHTSNKNIRNMEAFLSGLRAASACEVPENDVFRFRAVIERQQAFKDAVAFFKENTASTEAYVRDTLTAYLPEGLTYEGGLTLSVVGNPCGGFATTGNFYLALNCLTESYEAELSTAQLVAAHEIYHDIQLKYFYGDEIELKNVETRTDAYRFLLRGLLLEGSAEYVTNSRTITGTGTLSDLLKGFADNGYAQQARYIRSVGYAADIIADHSDWRERLDDIFMTGLTGAGRQTFYYAGAAMAGHIEATYGRQALICILPLPAEQFVRAYQAAAEDSENENAPPLSPTMVTVVEGLGKDRTASQRFEHCIS